MGGWQDQIWETDSDLGNLPYQSRTPFPIAELNLWLTPAQEVAARQLERQLRDWCADPDTAMCDPFLQLFEASGSSGIEGIQPSLRRLARARFTGRGRPNDAAVLANVAALDTALELGVTPSPTSVADICAVHAALAKDLPGYPRRLHPPGRLRTEQNWIGGSGRFGFAGQHLGPAAPDVKFVPPAPDLVEPLLEDLVAFANRRDIPVIPQAAVLHARFEEIHPFADGNGRVGRALVHHQWAKRGLLTRNATVPISADIALATGDYEQALRVFQHHEGSLEANSGAAVAPIVDLFLNTTALALETAMRLEQQIRAVQRAWRSQLWMRRGSLLARVLANMPQHPVFDHDLLRERYGVSRRQTERLIKQLTETGIVVLRKVDNRRRAFEASALIDLFTHQAPQEDEHGSPPPENSPPARQHARRPAGREVCGVFMPLAKKRCALYRGHKGPHRSARHWKR